MEVLDENGNLTYEPDSTGKGKEVVMEDRYFYLLHWGLQSGAIQHKDGTITPFMNTVAICQDKETGKVRLFDPEVLTILGEEMKL